ncbi:hydroxymethylbilane synthase [Nanchangia anserum]|uniref:Hydroxymethylbilane synthase n=1 Tax=Nanchangia anserum TaxID=2692125 RepID=A0A8I0KQ51_9ACTO|nr:hydroxymethylbilane synthase [Nanchangia anserum]MBD3689600.1 hydroxymethylbilane synthase [Nanchangia anserum]QOX81783.1 hydroxymethylbilane synthase [Nanchangia anserum]
MSVILGTRGSDLALTQSRTIAQALTERGIDVEMVTIRTEGDITRESLSRLGGVGVFAAALRLAMLNGRCHLAVHSFKDLPTAPVPGLCLAAVPERAPVADVLCSAQGRRLSELPEGALVGTGSIRRAAQLLAQRPDLRICDIRGNVPTRLGRVGGLEDGPGDLDAVVLAQAGLARLGLLGRAAEILPTSIMAPAPAQGALAIEASEAALAENSELADALASLNDPTARAAALAERGVLAHLEAGCAAPVGALATTEGSEIVLRASVCALDGSRRASASGSTPLPADDDAAHELGTRVGRDLLAAGAADIADLHAERVGVDPDYFALAPGRDRFGAARS